MQTITQYILFFFIGILQDIIITYYYHSISKEHAWKAGVLSALVTIVNLVVLYKILTGIEDQALGIILAYAVGNGVGTAITIKRHYIKNSFMEKFFKQ